MTVAYSAQRVRIPFERIFDTPIDPARSERTMARPLAGYVSVSMAPSPKARRKLAQARARWAVGGGRAFAVIAKSSARQLRFTKTYIAHPEIGQAGCGADLACLRAQGHDLQARPSIG